MAREVWLRPNRRVLAVGALLLIVTLVGALMLLSVSRNPAVTLLSAAIAVLTAALLVLALRNFRRPRLAYEDGCLLVFLGSSQPHRVPIELVECFFLGQGPSLLPAATLAGEKDSPESSTIVVRLAESAEAWKHVEVNPSLGLWCDGYITIRGTWCEPINAARMEQLNQRLIDAHRHQRGRCERESA